MRFSILRGGVTFWTQVNSVSSVSARLLAIECTMSRCTPSWNSAPRSHRQ